MLRRFIREALMEAAGQETVDKVVRAIQQAGGEIYTVGGVVRDEVLGMESKDVDFLVRKLDYEAIRQAIEPIGKVIDQDVGGKVSMLKANVDGEEFDIAIPRTSEVKTGEGHTDFDITLDPDAPVESDLSRRDFTFNALAKDAKGYIIDKFGGVEDIKNKVVRAVGEPHDRFMEDPLRMLRALQFAARFGFTIEPKTAAAIKRLAPELKSIAGERVLMEMEKAWTKGRADIATLIRLLEELGVGEVLFGSDFDPVPVKIEDKAMGAFIGFFLNGGDYKSMKPTKEMQDYLSMARHARGNTSKIWKWIRREAVPVLIDVFNATGETEVAERLAKAEHLPLSPKELEVGGKELMKLGFKGKQIGQAMEAAMEAIHAGRLENERSALIEFIEGATI